MPSGRGQEIQVPLGELGLGPRARAGVPRLQAREGAGGVPAGDLEEVDDLGDDPDRQLGPGHPPGAVHRVGEAAEAARVIAFLASSAASFVTGTTICPVIKKLWTPSWAFYSGAVVLWVFALFYWFIDIKGHKAWTFPLVVVGMNSIFTYVIAALVIGTVLPYASLIRAVEEQDNGPEVTLDGHAF